MMGAYQLSTTFLALLLVGLLWGCVWSPTMALYDGLLVNEAKARGFVYGTLRVWSSVAFIAGTVVCGLAVDRFGPPSVLFVGWLGIACLLPFALLLPRGEARARDAGQHAPFGILDLLRSRPFLLFMIAAGFCQSSHAVLYSFGTLTWRSAGLSDVTISLLWGESDPARLPFLDPPPVAALNEAKSRLASLGAIDPQGRVTDHGRAIAALPLEPRLAHMLLDANARGFGGAAADAAVLLTERGLGGSDTDLELRWRRWRSDKSVRAEAARKLAASWRRRLEIHEADVNSDDLGKSIALAFPDRVARRRDRSGEGWQSVGGRGFRIDGASPLAGSQWLAVGEVAGRASGARILSAAVIDEQVVLDLFADRIETRHDGDFDPATGSVTPTRSRRLGAIRLASGPDPAPDEAAIAAALLDGVREHGLELLRWDDRSLQLRARATFAHRLDAAIAPLDDNLLIERAGEWLAPLLAGRRRLGDFPPSALATALEQLLGYQTLRRIDRLAPTNFVSPAGSSHRIDYSAPAGPAVEVRAQALFGLGSHPMIGDGRVPLILSITSPAGRPIQTTKDLPGFWAGSWRDVAKDMRGRYPKHPWPDDPASAPPTLQTKRASG